MAFFKELGKGNFKEALKAFSGSNETRREMSTEELLKKYANTTLDIITNTNQMIRANDSVRVLAGSGGERPTAPLVMFLEKGKVYSIQRDGLSVTVQESGGDNRTNENKNILIEGTEYEITGILNGKIQARGEGITTDLSTILRREEAKKHGGLYIDNYNGKSFLWTSESLMPEKAPTPLDEPFKGVELTDVSKTGDIYSAKAGGKSYEFKYENSFLVYREVKNPTVEFRTIPTPANPPKTNT
jgi:hypothetical protein